MAHEGEILAKINHPHIVRLLGVVNLDDGPRGMLRALVLEHLEGGSLEDRLGLDAPSPQIQMRTPHHNQPRMTARYGLELCGQIASALSYLHFEV